MRRVMPHSFTLLDPLDFMGGDDDEDLGFFPGMSMTADEEPTPMGQHLDIRQKRFEPVTMGEHVSRYPESRPLSNLKPEFITLRKGWAQHRSMIARPIPGKQGHGGS